MVFKHLCAGEFRWSEKQKQRERRNNYIPTYKGIEIDELQTLVTYTGSVQILTNYPLDEVEGLVSGIFIDTAPLP